MACAATLPYVVFLDWLIFHWLERGFDDPVPITMTTMTLHQLEWRLAGFRSTVDSPSVMQSDRIGEGQAL